MKTSTILQYSLAVILFVIQKQADGIQCYQCNSHNDSRCASDKLPDALKKDCASLEKESQGHTFTMCRKITQVIEFEVNGMPPDNRVIRGCGWEESSYKGRCYQRSGFGGRQEVCSCTDDYCNSSTKYASVWGLLSVMAVISSLFYFMNI